MLLQIQQVLLKVSLQAFRLYIEFLQHLLEHGTHRAMFLQQLPDPGADIVQPEVDSFGQVRQHAFAFHLLKERVGRRGDLLVEIDDRCGIGHGETPA